MFLNIIFNFNVCENEWAERLSACVSPAQQLSIFYVILMVVWSYSFPTLNQALSKPCIAEIVYFGFVDKEYLVKASAE